MKKAIINESRLKIATIVNKEGLPKEDYNKALGIKK